MKIDINLFKSLWEKYINQCISEEEYTALMLMINSEDYSVYIESEIDQLIEAAEAEKNETVQNLHAESNWEAIQLLIKKKTSTKIVDATLYSSKRKNRRLWAAAVFLFLVLSATYYKYLYKNSTGLENTVITTGTNPSELKNIKTIIGPQNYLLIDGSSVILKKNTTLRFDSLAFAKGKYRDVLLQGEAFFDIRHIEQRPFVVHTDSINTTVLGTSFDIATTKHGDILVTVVTGRVSVNNNGKELAVLNPNRSLKFKKETAQIGIYNADAEKSVQWAKQSLIFKDLPLSDAAILIEKKFNIAIEISAPLMSIRVNAQFTHNENLSDILDMLTAITETRSIREGDKYKILYR